MTMATRNLPEARISPKERSITARYDTGVKKPATEFESEASILFTLSVSYTKAGINYWNGERTTTDYFSITVLNETQRENGVIGFVVGRGVGLGRVSNPSNRFSRKKLQHIFVEWKVIVEGLLSLDEDQLHHLDKQEKDILDAILPYWRGEKAGLA